MNGFGYFSRPLKGLNKFMAVKRRRLHSFIKINKAVYCTYSLNACNDQYRVNSFFLLRFGRIPCDDRASLGCLVRLLLKSLRLLIDAFVIFRVAIKRHSGGCHAFLNLACIHKTGFGAFEFNGGFTMLARPSQRTFPKLGRNTS